MKRIIYCFIFCLPITIYGQKSFSTGTFQNIGSYKLMGSAKIIDGDLSLTRDDEWVAGACWYKKKVLVQYGFETEFQFIMDKHGGWQGVGADGLAFVINNDPQGFRVGEKGEGIGYGGFKNCVVIEFDIFDNQEGSDSHISVQTNGRGEVRRFADHSLAINHNIPYLKSKLRKAKITYDFKYIRVYIDGKLYLKKELHLEKKIKLDKGKAYIGFTAATAGAYSRHRILNWKWKREKKILANREHTENNITKLATAQANEYDNRLYQWYKYNFYPPLSTKTEKLHFEQNAVIRRNDNDLASEMRQDIIYI